MHADRQCTHTRRGDTCRIEGYVQCTHARKGNNRGLRDSHTGIQPMGDRPTLLNSVAVQTRTGAQQGGGGGET